MATAPDELRENLNALRLERAARLRVRGAGSAGC